MVQVVLLFGVTGMTGRHVIKQAMALPANQYRIVCYVRNPSKIVDWDSIKSSIEVVQGDFTDDVALEACVVSTRPDSIIIAASLGFSNDTTKYLCKPLMESVVCALTTDGRLSACRILYLSGCASPNPPIPADFAYNFILWAASIKAPVNDNNAVHNFLYTCPPELRYTVVKMGMVTEGNSIGKIKGIICTKDMAFNLRQILFNKGVKFCDVASFLLELLVANDSKEYDGHYLWMKYSK